MVKIKRDMTEGNITSALLRFIIPLTAGNIFQQLYNIADTFIVGHYLGSNALASVGAVSSTIFLFNAVMMGLKAGISVILSGDYGKRDYVSYRKSQEAAKLLILIGILLTLLIGLVGGKYILNFIQVPIEIWDMSMLYFRIIILGYPFLFLFNYGNAVMQSVGNSQIVFWALSSSTLINVVLDIVFIRVLGMGVEGAALATVFSQIMLAIVLLVAIRTNITILEIKSNKISKGFSILEKLKEILQVAFPSMLQQGILSIGVIMINSLINRCGTEMIAGVSISGKIEGIATMPIVTIGEALAVFTAQNLGAGKPERINKGLKSAIKICSLFGVALAVLVIFQGKLLISLFLNQYNSVIIEKGYQYMISIMVMIFFMIPFRCFIGVVTGMKNMSAVLISFGLNIIGRVVSAYLLYPVVREYAIYIANPFSVLVGMITVIILYGNRIELTNETRLSERSAA